MSFCLRWMWSYQHAHSWYFYRCCCHSALMLQVSQTLSLSSFNLHYFGSSNIKTLLFPKFCPWYQLSLVITCYCIDFPVLKDLSRPIVILHAKNVCLKISVAAIWWSLILHSSLNPDLSTECGFGWCMNQVRLSKKNAPLFPVSSLVSLKQLSSGSASHYNRKQFSSLFGCVTRDRYSRCVMQYRMLFCMALE